MTTTCYRYFYFQSGLPNRAVLLVLNPFLLQKIDQIFITISKISFNYIF